MKVMRQHDVTPTSIGQGPEITAGCVTQLAKHHAAAGIRGVIFIAH